MTNIEEKPKYISREEKNGITKEVLNAIFDYKDGFLYWKISYNPKIVIGSQFGYVNVYTNATRYRGKVLGHTYLMARLIFLYHNNQLSECIDHIDHDTMNNKIENLRAATKLENNRNSSSRKNSSSQYCGVSFHIRIKKWGASVRINNRQIHIGYFDSEIEAALAYNRFAVKYYKEFANLNIIKP